jgi:hypothetical protein
VSIYLLALSHAIMIVNVGSGMTIAILPNQITINMLRQGAV